jgi:hypothetical protein
MKINVQGVDATDLTAIELATLAEMVSDAVEGDTSQSPGDVEILTDDGSPPWGPEQQNPSRRGDSA